MLRTFNTLMRGFAAEREEAVIDRYSVTLLDQKIRDCEMGLKSAKAALAGLMARQRLEARQLAQVKERIEDLTSRASAALDAGSEDLARTAATAIAELENEKTARQRTVDAVDARVDRMKLSLERAVRRMTDLRQAAATARAVDLERRGQRRIADTVPYASDLQEAEALVSRIMGQDDPFETDEILCEIDHGLSGAGAAETLAQAGFGPKTKVSADDVMARLKTAKI